MRQCPFWNALCTVLLVGLVFTVLPVADVQARAPAAENQPPDKSRTKKQGQNQHTLTAAEAASRAKARYGGKVLKVRPNGKAYRVKLLTDSGRVVTVTIKN